MSMQTRSYKPKSLPSGLMSPVKRRTRSHRPGHHHVLNSADGGPGGPGVTDNHIGNNFDQIHGSSGPGSGPTGHQGSSGFREKFSELANIFDRLEAELKFIGEYDEWDSKKVMIVEMVSIRITRLLQKTSAFSDVKRRFLGSNDQSLQNQQGQSDNLQSLMGPGQMPGTTSSASNNNNNGSNNNNSSSNPTNNVDVQAAVDKATEHLHSQLTERNKELRNVKKQLQQLEQKMAKKTQKQEKFKQILKKKKGIFSLLAAGQQNSPNSKHDSDSILKKNSQIRHLLNATELDSDSEFFQTSSPKNYHQNGESSHSGSQTPKKNQESDIQQNLNPSPLPIGSGLPSGGFRQQITKSMAAELLQAPKFNYNTNSYNQSNPRNSCQNPRNSGSDRDSTGPVGPTGSPIPMLNSNNNINNQNSTSDSNYMNSNSSESDTALLSSLAALNRSLDVESTMGAILGADGAGMIILGMKKQFGLDNLEIQGGVNDYENQDEQGGNNNNGGTSGGGLPSHGGKATQAGTVLTSKKGGNIHNSSISKSQYVTATSGGNDSSDNSTESSALLSSSDDDDNIVSPSQNNNNNQNKQQHQQSESQRIEELYMNPYPSRINHLMSITNIKEHKEGRTHQRRMKECVECNCVIYEPGGSDVLRHFNAQRSAVGNQSHKNIQQVIYQKSQQNFAQQLQEYQQWQQGGGLPQSSKDLPRFGSDSESVGNTIRGSQLGQQQNQNQQSPNQNTNVSKNRNSNNITGSDSRSSAGFAHSVLYIPLAPTQAGVMPGEIRDQERKRKDQRRKWEEASRSHPHLQISSNQSQTGRPSMMSMPSTGQQESDPVGVLVVYLNRLPDELMNELILNLQKNVQNNRGGQQGVQQGNNLYFNRGYKEAERWGEFTTGGAHHTISPNNKNKSSQSNVRSMNPMPGLVLDSFHVWTLLKESGNTLQRALLFERVLSYKKQDDFLRSIIVPVFSLVDSARKLFQGLSQIIQKLVHCEYCQIFVFTPTRESIFTYVGVTEKEIRLIDSSNNPAAHVALSGEILNLRNYGKSRYARTEFVDDVLISNALMVPILSQVSSIAVVLKSFLQTLNKAEFGRFSAQEYLNELSNLASQARDREKQQQYINMRAGRQGGGGAGVGVSARRASAAYGAFYDKKRTEATVFGVIVCINKLHKSSVTDVAKTSDPRRKSDGSMRVPQMTGLATQTNPAVGLAGHPQNQGGVGVAVSHSSKDGSHTPVNLEEQEPIIDCKSSNPIKNLNDQSLANQTHEDLDADDQNAYDNSVANSRKTSQIITGKDARRQQFQKQESRRMSRRLSQGGTTELGLAVYPSAPWTSTTSLSITPQMLPTSGSQQGAAGQNQIMLEGFDQRDEDLLSREINSLCYMSLKLAGQQHRTGSSLEVLVDQRDSLLEQIEKHKVDRLNYQKICRLMTFAAASTDAYTCLHRFLHGASKLLHLAEIRFIMYSNGNNQQQTGSSQRRLVLDRNTYIDVGYLCTNALIAKNVNETARLKEEFLEYAGLKNEINASKRLFEQTLQHGADKLEKQESRVKGGAGKDHKQDHHHKDQDHAKSSSQNATSQSDHHSQKDHTASSSTNKQNPHLLGDGRPKYRSCLEQVFATQETLVLYGNPLKSSSAQVNTSVDLPELGSSAISSYDEIVQSIYIPFIQDDVRPEDDSDIQNLVRNSGGTVGSGGGVGQTAGPGAGGNMVASNANSGVTDSQQQTSSSSQSGTQIQFIGTSSQSVNIADITTNLGIDTVTSGSGPPGGNSNYNTYQAQYQQQGISSLQGLGSSQGTQGQGGTGVRRSLHGIFRCISNDPRHDKDQNLAPLLESLIKLLGQICNRTALASGMKQFMPSSAVNENSNGGGGGRYAANKKNNTEGGKVASGAGGGDNHNENLNDSTNNKNNNINENSGSGTGSSGAGSAASKAGDSMSSTEAVREICASYGLKDLLNTVMSATKKSLKCERAYVLSVDPVDESSLWTLDPHRDSVKLEIDINPNSSKYLESSVYHSNSIVNLNRWETRMSTKLCIDSSLGYQPETLLIVPIRYESSQFNRSDQRNNTNKSKIFNANDAAHHAYYKSNKNQMQDQKQLRLAVEQRNILGKHTVQATLSKSVIGVIVAVNKIGGESFSQIDEMALLSYSQACGVGLKHALAQLRIAQSVREYEFFVNGSISLLQASSRDFCSFIGIAEMIASRLTSMPFVDVFFLNNEGNCLVGLKRKFSTHSHSSSGGQGVFSSTHNSSTAKDDGFGSSSSSSQNAHQGSHKQPWNYNSSRLTVLSKTNFNSSQSGISGTGVNPNMQGMHPSFEDIVSYNTRHPMGNQQGSGTDIGGQGPGGPNITNHPLPESSGVLDRSQFFECLYVGGVSPYVDECLEGKILWPRNLFLNRYNNLVDENGHQLNYQQAYERIPKQNINGMTQSNAATIFNMGNTGSSVHVPTAVEAAVMQSQSGASPNKSKTGSLGQSQQSPNRGPGAGQPGSNTKDQQNSDMDLDGQNKGSPNAHKSIRGAKNMNSNMSGSNNNNNNNSQQYGANQGGPGTGGFGGLRNQNDPNHPTNNLRSNPNVIAIASTSIPFAKPVKRIVLVLPIIMGSGRVVGLLRVADHAFNSTQQQNGGGGQEGGNSKKDGEGGGSAVGQGLSRNAGPAKHMNTDFLSHRLRNIDLGKLKSFSSIVGQMSVWMRRICALNDRAAVISGSSGSSSLSQFQNLLPRLLLVTDKDGRLYRFHGSAKAVLGKSDSNLRSQPCWSWFPESENPVWVSAMRRVYFGSEQSSLSGVYVRDFHWLLHGTIYTCELFVIPLLTADRGYVENINRQSANDMKTDGNPNSNQQSQININQQQANNQQGSNDEGTGNNQDQDSGQTGPNATAMGSINNTNLLKSNFNTPNRRINYCFISLSNVRALNSSIMLPIYVTSDSTQDLSHGLWKTILGSEKNAAGAGGVLGTVYGNKVSTAIANASTNNALTNQSTSDLRELLAQYTLLKSKFLTDVFLCVVRLIPLSEQACTTYQVLSALMKVTEGVGKTGSSSVNGSGGVVYSIEKNDLYILFFDPLELLSGGYNLYQDLSGLLEEFAFDLLIVGQHIKAYSKVPEPQTFLLQQGQNHPSNVQNSDQISTSTMTVAQQVQHDQNAMQSYLDNCAPVGLIEVPQASVFEIRKIAARVMNYDFRGFFVLGLGEFEHDFVLLPVEKILTLDLLSKSTYAQQRGSSQNAAAGGGGASGYGTSSLITGGYQSPNQGYNSDNDGGVPNVNSQSQSQGLGIGMSSPTSDNKRVPNLVGGPRGEKVTTRTSAGMGSQSQALNQRKSMNTSQTSNLWGEKNSSTALFRRPNTIYSVHGRMSQVPQELVNCSARLQLAYKALESSGSASLTAVHELVDLLQNDLELRAGVLSVSIAPQLVMLLKRALKCVFCGEQINSNIGSTQNQNQNQNNNNNTNTGGGPGIGSTTLGTSSTGVASMGLAPGPGPGQQSSQGLNISSTVPMQNGIWLDYKEPTLEELMRMLSNFSTRIGDEPWLCQFLEGALELLVAVDQ